MLGDIVSVAETRFVRIRILYSKYNPSMLQQSDKTRDGIVREESPCEGKLVFRQKLDNNNKTQRSCYPWAQY